MAEKLSGWGTTKLLLGLVLFIPGAGALLWIISNEDARRTIHEGWQRAVRGHFDSSFVTYNLPWLLAVAGFALMRSAFK
jgi:hypothetical protein